jgi:phosphate-selective porin OprO/OprP
MKLSSKKNFIYAALTLTFAFFPLASVRAQGLQIQIPQAVSNRLRNTGFKTSTKREEELVEEVDKLKAKIEQLQSLVEQQQNLLANIEQRISAISVKPSTDSASAQSSEISQAPKTDPVSALTEKESKIQNSTPTPAQVQPQTQSTPVAGWDRNHAFLRSRDGSFEAQIIGYGQLDFRGYQSGNHPANTFLIRRARLALEGRVHNYYRYKIEGDFADTAGTILRDFYLRIQHNDETQLTFGQFRVPISQEEIRSDAFQDFVERSLVNNLVPSRSPGIMLSGTIRKGLFEYQVGAFNGKGLLALNDNGTPETALRLRIAPWRNSKTFFAKGLIFGGAFTQGRSLNGLSVRGQTESRSVTFFAPDTINGKYTRANGELTWLVGPLAIRAEYDQTDQRRENLGVDRTNLPGVVAKGYMGQVTYLLTGENKPEADAVAPRHSVFGDENGERGFGAWELKFRYASLQIEDGTAKSNRAQTFYFGPNWYLNRFIRYTLDFGVERFSDPLRTPKPGDNNFMVVLSRIQVAF